MMDDECRACKRRQRTASHCPLSHRVLLAASANVRKLDKATCQGMGARSTQAQMGLKAPARGSVRQRRPYLESPFPTEPCTPLENEAVQPLDVRATDQVAL